MPPCLRLAVDASSEPIGKSVIQISRSSQAHVFIRCCQVELRVKTDRSLLHARPNAVQRSRLEDRAVHDALVHELLDSVQQRLAFWALTLARLLLEQIV